LAITLLPVVLWSINIAPLAAAEEVVEQGLISALRATLTHHPAVKGKHAELDAQGYMVDSAKAGRYPTFSLQANNLDDEVNQSSVRLQQPVWTFGKISSAIDEAEAGYTAEQWGLLQVKRQLIVDTAATYAKVEGIHRRERVAWDNLAQHKQLFQRIERRQKGALATEADVQLANSRLIQARVQREGIVGELQVALSELRALTQIPVATEVPVDPALAELPSREEVENLALEKSADVQFKRQRVNVARLEIEKERAASKPNIYFQVDHDLNDSQVNVDRTRVGLNFVASYDGLGLRSRGQVKSAVARSNAAQYDLDATLNEVRRSISVLLVNRKVQQGLILSQREVVDSLTATMASFMRQYESGRKSWVEVLNTQRELTEQRLLLAQIENDWLILSLRVATLIGSLDQQAGIKAL